MSVRPFVDSYGVEYRRVFIMSNGLCGYASVSYCVSGNSEQYLDIIHDAITVFDLNEELFVQHVEVASGMSLLDYKEMMRLALEDLYELRMNVPEPLWLDAGHLMACSLMYDITIYVYNMRLCKWLVYNGLGQEGYCCLLYTGDHYDVLIGSDSLTPPIPHEFLIVGPNRVDCNWIDVPFNRQRYNFSRVWKWPHERPDIQVYIQEGLPPAPVRSVHQISEGTSHFLTRQTLYLA
jgi:hypothetical protein